MDRVRPPAEVPWGVAFGGAPTLLQTALADTTGDAVDTAQSVFVTIFNSAIAAGGVVGGLIGWFSEINLFADYIPNLLVGRMLSTVVIGGGSNLIHDLASNKPKPT